jgi:hypothetical protein
MPAFTDYHEHILSIVSKLFFGYGSTDVVKRPMEERERFNPLLPLDSRIIMHPSEIWGDDLPALPPAADTPIVAVHKSFPAPPGEQGAWMTAMRTDVVANLCWITTLAGGGGAGGEFDPRITDWIPEKYGSAWAYTIHEDAGGTPGAQIPWTDASGPLFDPQSGTLTFEIDPTGAPLWTAPFWVKGYRFVGRDLATIISSIIVGAGITVEDSVPVPFPNTNLVRFSSSFVVTALGAGQVQVSLVGGVTWPWANRLVLICPADYAPGIPADFAIAPPATVMNSTVFVFVEGVKMMYGAGKDFIFTAPGMIRFLNLAGRTILMQNMEIEAYWN